MDDYLQTGKVQTDLAILSKGPPTAVAVGNTPRGLSPVGKRREDLFLQGYGRQWGEKLTYSVGLAYGTGMLCGGTFGLFKGLRKGGGTPKLFLNSVLNSCAAHGPGLANQTAVITMLYCGFNNLIQLVSGSDEVFVSTAAGALAGGLFKAAASWRMAAPYSLASAGLFTAVDYGFRYGYI